MKISYETGSLQQDGRRVMMVRGTVAGADAQREAIEVVASVFVPNNDSTSTMEAKARQVARNALEEMLSSI